MQPDHSFPNGPALERAADLRLLHSHRACGKAIRGGFNPLVADGRYSQAFSVPKVSAELINPIRPVALAGRAKLSTRISSR